MGRNMFGPVRGPWDVNWRWWWGDEPPYHGGEVQDAESWNGSSWTPQSVPLPSGAQGEVLLTGVSCSSASTCVAVGWYWGSSGEVAFAASSSGASPPPPPPPPPCAAGVCAVAPTFGPQSGGTPITITGGPFVSGSGYGYMVCFKRVGSYGGVCTSATVVNGTTLRATTPPRPV